MATGASHVVAALGEMDLSQRFDPFDPAQAVDPFPIWKESVEREPVFYSAPLGAWIVTRHAIIEKVLQDNTHFLNSGLSTIRTHPPEVQAILDQVRERAQPLRAIDAPEHMRRRRLSQGGVSPQRVSQLEPRVREIANALVDGFYAEGRCDFYERFAYRYPLAVISSLLGFPIEAADKLHHWANCRVAIAWGNEEIERYGEIARGVVEFHEFIEAEVKKHQVEPRDDMISDFVRINADAKQPVSMSELIEQLHSLVTAGHESTANWITLTLFNLLHDRSRWEKVCARPEGIPKMLEEALRFDGPVLGVWRRAGADAEIEGVPIAEHAKVYCVVGAGNRDPEVFDDPAAFAPERDNLRQLMTFGRGPHTCIGASLARLEGRVAFGVLVERLPNVRLAQDRLEFGENATLRMPRRLLLEWDV
jgi:cytochrome P450